MPKTDTSSKVNNSTLTPAVFDVQQQIHYKYLNKTTLLWSMSTRYFANKICKIKNCVYLCNARPMQAASQSTYSNAIKRCPLSTSAMQLCRSRKLNGGNASFLHTYFNF